MEAQTHYDILLFFLYSIPCEFLASLAPHEPAVLYTATLYSPVVVALVAGAGTLVAEILNYELMRRLRSTSALDRLARARATRKLSSAFERAPFASLWVAGFVPFVPFFPFRAFVLVSGYSRAKYLAASVTSRTARFYAIGLLGATFRPSMLAIALLFVVLVLATTIPGAYNYFARTRQIARARGEGLEET